MKAEAIDRGHSCFQRLNSCKYPGEQNKRIRVVSIHVLNDLAVASASGSGRACSYSMVAVATTAARPSHSQSARQKPWL